MKIEAYQTHISFIDWADAWNFTKEYCSFVQAFSSCIMHIFLAKDKILSYFHDYTLKGLIACLTDFRGRKGFERGGNWEYRKG